MHLLSDLTNLDQSELKSHLMTITASISCIDFITVNSPNTLYLPKLIAILTMHKSILQSKLTDLQLEIASRPTPEDP